MLATLYGLFQWSGKIGPGTVLTGVAIIGGMAWAIRRWDQGDPSEWRENYQAQLDRTRDLETHVAELQRKIEQQASLIKHLEDTRSLEPVLAALERIAARLDHVIPGTKGTQ